MTTHKRFVQELKPVTFLTFDQDNTWDTDSKYLLYGNTIYDESNNGEAINGILHFDDDSGVVRPSYYMGQTSMIENHLTGIYSMVFAPHKYDDSNSFKFVKSFIEIPYTNALELPKSFSYTMMFNVKSSISEMRSYRWDSTQMKHVPVGGGSSNSNDIYRTIIKKGDKFSLTYVSYYYSGEALLVKFPNNTGTIYVSNIFGGLVGRDVNFSATHEYIEMDDGRYYTESKVYIDNIVIYSSVSTPVFGNYYGGNTSSIYLCGNQDNYDYNSLNDRWTTPIAIDQFAIFDYALDSYTIATLHKKIFSFVSIMDRCYPDRYYKFDELDTALVFNNRARSGSNYNLYPKGDNQQVIFNQTGVHGIYGESAVKVQQGGMIYRNIGNGSSYFNTSGDLTIEFFASFTGSQRGILFSLQDDIYPFRGITLFVNSKENTIHSGMIQLSVADGRYCHTNEFNVRGERIYYNDGVMRHYAIRRNGVFMELWINGVLISKTYFESGDVTSRPNSLYLFNFAPNTMYVEGKIQHLALYTRLLSKEDLYIHATYLLKYTISGRVTVGGIGEKIMIRIYSFNDGSLIQENMSDGDGKYKVDIHYGDYINFVFMKKNDISVRPRTIGAILPDEFADLPWQ